MGSTPGRGRLGLSEVEKRLPKLRPCCATPAARAQVNTNATLIAYALSVASLLTGLFHPVGAVAQEASELSFLAGSISSRSEWPRSYAWSFSSRHVGQEYFSTTVSYLNQGHFPGHHRDGITFEPWVQTDLF